MPLLVMVKTMDVMRATKEEQLSVVIILRLFVNGMFLLVNIIFIYLILPIIWQ
jgi:hypothetical protein